MALAQAHGWNAVFTDPRGDGKPRYEIEPVVCWAVVGVDDSGVPDVVGMVLNADGTGLIPVPEQPNFICYEHESVTRVYDENPTHPPTWPRAVSDDHWLGPVE